MSLKPDAEVSIALATSVMAYGAFQMALPNAADVRSLEPQNADIQGAEKTAAWVAAGMVSFVALITKSPNVFILGGATVIAASWTMKYADQISPISKAAGHLIPSFAVGTEGVVGDKVEATQQMPSTPLYGVAV